MKYPQNKDRPRRRFWGTFGYVGNMAAFVVILSNLLLPVSPAFASEENASSTNNAPVTLEPAAITPPPEAATEEGDANAVASETPEEEIESATIENNTDGEVAFEEARSEAASATATSDGTQSEYSDTKGTSTKLHEPDELQGTTTDAAPSEDGEHATSSGGEILGDATTTIEHPDDEGDGIADTSGGELADTATTSDDENATTSGPLDENIDTEIEGEMPLDESADAIDADTVVDDAEQDAITEEPASSTDDTLPKQEETQAVNIVFNDENRYLFSKDECLSVGDGSFYCTQATSSATAYGTDRVFAATDEEGDREIYIEEGGEVTQITSNLTDDDAPYYDEISNTIVWHRLIDGRYQIMEYDLTRRSERQLTTERYNNMQPTREGDSIVWQGWVGSDWEILTEEEGELEMLTDNDFHDIAPHINGDYVIWQSFEGDIWQVKVYDQKTGEIQTISDDEGGSAQNPRFVLVYDTKQENGDIETKGYDLESGRVVPLSSKPAPTPKSIPDPDPTDEERAMVQQVVQVKTKSESETDTSGTGGTGTTTDDIIPDDGDVVIAPLGSGQSGTTTETGARNASSTAEMIEDIQIAPLSNDGAEEQKPPIEDVIVPAFDASATSTDSQHTVATST